MIDFFLSDVSDGFFGSSFRKGKIENKYYTSWLVASDDAG